MKLRAIILCAVFLLSGASPKANGLCIFFSPDKTEQITELSLGKSRYFLKECRVPVKKLFKGGADFVNDFFEQNPYTLTLYELYTVTEYGYRKIAENICDISPLYDNGRGEAVFKTLSPDKVKLSKSDTVFSAIEKAELKYIYADAYLLREGKAPVKIAHTSADYFEISGGVYYLEGDSLYCGSILLLKGVCDFFVRDGRLYYFKE